MLPFELLLSFLFLSSALPSVHSTFTFEFGVPRSCDNLELSWTGGEAPFELLVVPIFETPRNYTIPDSVVTDGKGFYSVQANFPVNQQLFLVMSDATGVGSGGTSLITEVGPSVSGESCNTTDPGGSFTFALSPSLTQCGSYEFTVQGSPVQPVTIIGYIPGGEVIQLHIPTGATSYNWTANLRAGTSVVWTMVDSKGRSGGSSHIEVVGQSSNTGCLVGSAYPTSTSNPPTPTSLVSPSTSSSNSLSSHATPPPSSSTSLSSPPTPSPSLGGAKSNRLNIAAATSGSLGGLLGLVLVCTLGLSYFLWKKKRENDPEELQHDDDSHDDQAVSNITPFLTLQVPPSLGHLQRYKEAFRGADRVLPHREPSPPNPERKAPRTRPSRRPRYILHTDAMEDVIPEHGDWEAIELPPMYSEQRRPLPSTSIAGPSLFPGCQSPPSERPKTAP